MKAEQSARASRSGRSLIEERFRQNTVESADLTSRARSSMPGANTRTTSFYPPYPVVFDHGKGPWLWDIDNRRYVDLFCNGLSLIHGNCYVPVNRAIEQALERGLAWSGASREQIAFAELLQSRLRAAELVRFTSSGSEATMLTVKASRHLTGRPLIVKSVGAYHGSYPDLEAGLYGCGDIAGRTIVAPFNDLDKFRALFDRYGAQIAAVMIEPVLVTGRVVAPNAGFLKDLERLARRHGALVILDDCLMLRLAEGGSTEVFDLDPDFIALGKFIGGGTPMGAIGGRRDYMKLFDPTQPRAVFHGGSFNGNPIGCVAGKVALTDLTSARISNMDAHAAAIRGAINEDCRALGLGVTVSGFGSVSGIAFDADTSRHEDDPSALGIASLFHLACLNHGVALGPGGIIAISTAHDAPAISFAIQGLREALQDIVPMIGR